MSSLLEVVDLTSTIKQTRRGPRNPLMLEFEVNAELAPYLVSSTRAVMWVSKASEAGMIRAAVRKRTGLEAELLAAVVDMGVEAEWGNVHPLTTEGIAKCVEHLRYYEFDKLEIVVSPGTELEGVVLPSVPCSAAPWVPLDSVVVVPADRGYVGTLGVIGQHKAVAVVHNPSRGVAVAWR